MAVIWADRIVELSTTTGTGAFTLAGPPTGFRAFSAVCATNDVVYYMIEGLASGGLSGEWETGLGTYSAANTLTRTTVTGSSNANAAVSFSAGTKRVVLSQIATNLPRLAPPRWSQFGTALNTGVGYVTLADDQEGMLMYVGVGGAGITIRAKLKSNPSTPFSIVFRLQSLGSGNTTDGCGLIIRDSSTGRLVKFGRQFNTTGNAYIIERWTSDTVFGTTTLTGTAQGESGWYKFTDDGTNHKYYIGLTNGVWAEVLSESRTIWLAAQDQIGFGIEDQTLTDYFMLVKHYEEL